MCWSSDVAQSLRLPRRDLEKLGGAAPWAAPGPWPGLPNSGSSPKPARGPAAAQGGRPTKLEICASSSFQQRALCQSSQARIQLILQRASHRLRVLDGPSLPFHDYLTGAD